MALQFMPLPPASRETAVKEMMDYVSDRQTDGRAITPYAVSQMNGCILAGRAVGTQTHSGCGVGLTQ